MRWRDLVIVAPFVALVLLQAYPILRGPGRIRRHILTTGKLGIATVLRYEPGPEGGLCIVYRFRPEGAESPVECARGTSGALRKILPVGTETEVRYLASAPSESLLVRFADLLDVG